MAWVSTHRKTELEYSTDNGIEKTATNYYLVVFNSPASAIAAEIASGVPAVGSAHPDDGNRLCKQKRPQMVDGSNREHWLVQCDYSDKSPLNAPIQIEWDFSEGTETYFIDYGSEYGGTDTNATNTAGDPFEKLPERERGEWSATWQKNVLPSYSIANEISCMQCVNDSSVTFDGQTIAQYAAKISGGSLSGVQIENGIYYRTLKFKIKFRDGGWKDQFEDRGFREIKTSGAEPTQIVKGTPATAVDKPYPLDGSGKAKTNSTDPGNQLTFYPYHSLDFTTILV